MMTDVCLGFTVQCFGWLPCQAGGGLTMNGGCDENRYVVSDFGAFAQPYALGL